MNVSVTDLKKNYDNLDVSFDLWLGESDSQAYIPDMVQKMKDDGFAYISNGALVAITLMIVESNPAEKDIMVAMVMNLLKIQENIE